MGEIREGEIRTLKTKLESLHDSLGLARKSLLKKSLDDVPYNEPLIEAIQLVDDILENLVGCWLAEIEQSIIEGKEKLARWLEMCK